jgi:DNA-binding GntR family transcriptional regulator
VSANANTKVDEVATLIEQAILSGEFPSGMVLRQEELCAELGVSRTPVREALRHLAAVGLVSLEPNRGARVRLPPDNDLKDSYLIRAELEALAAELAVPRMTREEIKSLKASERTVADLTQKLQAASGEREIRWLTSEWSRANIEFHGIILEAAQSQLLRRMTNMVSVQRTYIDIVWSNTPELDRLYAVSIEQHRAIVAGFAAHDANVRNLVAQHVRDSLELAEAIFANATPRRQLRRPEQLSGRTTRSIESIR